MPADETEPRERDTHGTEDARGEGADASQAVSGDGSQTIRTVEERPAVLRRQVRLGRFLALGLIGGILVAMVLTFFVPENPGFVPADPTLHFSETQVFGFLLVYLCPVGIGIGGVVGLLVGRLGARSQRVTVARHTVRTVDPANEDGEEPEELAGPEALRDAHRDAGGAEDSDGESGSSSAA